MRFRLSTMFGVTAMYGCGTCLLTRPTDVSVAVTHTGVFGLLLLAALGAMYCTGLSRAFWVGFALFGWAFFYFEIHSSGNFDSAPTLLADYVYSQVKDSLPAVVELGVAAEEEDYGSWTDQSYRFRSIFVLLMAPSLGLVGGALSSWLHSRSRARQLIATLPGSN